MANDHDLPRGLDVARVERPKGAVTTPRILFVLALLVVISVVVAKVVNRDDFELRVVPSELTGLWVTDHQDLSDRFVEFRPNSVRLGTGGTDEVKFRVIGLDTEPVGEDRHFSVFYRDVAGKEYVMEVRLDEIGEELRFMDQPGVVWKRLER
jgi:hypothetical protein